MGDVEKQRAGSVGHIGGALAGEAEANVVFRKHEGANTFPILRLVLANPKQFCKREIGERRVACELNQAFLADFGG